MLNPYRLIENKVEENPTTAHNHIELIAVNGFSTPIKDQPEQFEGEVGWLLRECTSHGGADLLRTCSAGGGSVKMASSIKKNGCIRWHCPVCDIALDVKKGQHAKITRHIHRMHHDYVAKNLEANRSCGYRSSKATSGIGIRDLMQPIKFTKVGPNAHFLCPFCDEGLATKPRSRHLLVMSKKAHLINDCKKVKKSLKRMPILKYTRMGWKKHGIQRPIWGERSKIIAERAKANVDMMQLTLRWCCLIRPKSQKTKGRSSCSTFANPVCPTAVWNCGPNLVARSNAAKLCQARNFGKAWPKRMTSRLSWRSLPFPMRKGC